MDICDAAIALHLRIRLKQGAEEAFAAYVREAFPVFEACCDCRGVVYRDEADPEDLDEVFYYRTESDFRTGARRTEEDPEQVALLARWRSLLQGPPRIEVRRRLEIK